MGSVRRCAGTGFYFAPRHEFATQSPAGWPHLSRQHHQSSFDITESDSQITFSLESADAEVSVKLEAAPASELPASSIFSTLAEASAFFEAGSLGYSVTGDPNRLDGLNLKTKQWQVDALDVSSISSSYFSDEAKFPRGSIEFDHALLMKNVAHEWHSAEDLYI